MSNRKKFLLVAALFFVTMLFYLRGPGNSLAERAQTVSSERHFTSSRPECQVRRVDGEIDGRECDLVELCADMKFASKKNDTKMIFEVSRYMEAYSPENVKVVCSGNYNALVRLPNGSGYAAQGDRAMAVMNSVMNTAPTRGGCAESPILAFQVGLRLSTAEFDSLIEKQCPGVSQKSAEQVRFIWESKTYLISSQKSSDPAGLDIYEIQSVRLVQ